MKRSHTPDRDGTLAFRHAKNSHVKGSNVVILEPTARTETLYEFELNSTQVVNFGPQTGFIVEGVFQKKENADGSAWAACPIADASSLLIQTNWFEHLIKQIDIFHVNSEISPHDVPLQADPYLNSYLLAHMHKSIKKYLCPEPCNPGNATNVEKTEWRVGAAEDTDYSNYIQHVLGKNKIAFRYIPLFKFPFYQGANFVLDKELPQPLPIPAIGGLHIRLYLKDGAKDGGMPLIFKRTGGALTAKYRFKIDSILLSLEELKLNPTIEKSLLTSKKRIAFNGVTKLGMAHNIPNGVFSYTAKLNKIYLPEGLFIFCLPKSVTPDTYNYTNFAELVFEKHQIKSVQVYFGGKQFYSKSPTPNDLEYLYSTNHHYFSHMNNPPFGIKQDPDLIKYNLLIGGADNSPYPHVYIDLTQGGPDTRLIPDNDDGSIIQGKEFLDVAIQFTTAVAGDKTYYVYYFYTDKNVILDMNAKRFQNVYNNTKLTV